MEFQDQDRTRLSVLGSPISHSLSPTLHRAAYAVLGLPFQYDRIEVGPGGLEDFIASLGPEWRGLSLTMPLKREVLPLLDVTTPLVDELGVANTLRFVTRDGTTVAEGANTDVDGLARPLETMGADVSEAAIVGGGATATSAMEACRRLGAESVTLFLRSPEKAGPLVELGDRIGLTTTVKQIERVGDAPRRLVISTLPGGAADGLPLTPADARSVLFDVAYEPWPTRIAERWSAAGGQLRNGLDMLVEQAVGQIRLFAGIGQETPLPDEAAVRREMRRSVGLPEEPRR